MPSTEGVSSFSTDLFILPKPSAAIVRFWFSGRLIVLLLCVIKTFPIFLSVENFIK